MSRQAATKSRGDKAASRGGGGAQSVTIPVVTNDILPGRLTVADWTKLLSADDDEDFVGSLVEDIVDNALEQCYEKYIWKQVLPYTVFNAKDDLLQILEWRFLSHDKGEEDVKGNRGWEEDAEPEPGIIDSWAQGSVPIIVTKSPEPMPVLEESLNKSEYIEEQNLDDSFSESISLATGRTQETEKEVKSPEPQKEKEEITDKKDTKKKKIYYKKHVGRLQSAHLGEMTKPLDKSESELFEKEFSSMNPEEDNTHLSPSQKSLLKLQAGRPPGNKEVTFDERGNVIAVMRLDSKSLPSHKVRVQYSIIDPEAEAAAQRLEAMRTGKLRSLSKVNWKPKPAKMKISPRIPTQESQVIEEKSLFPAPPRKHIHNAGKKSLAKPSTVQSTQRSVVPMRHNIISRRRADEETSHIEPLPPSLIESIDASPGVVITEGDQIKAGSARPLGPLRNVPVLREDGKIIRNVTLSTKDGKRTLRMLGTAPQTHPKYDSNIVVRPILSPSRVISHNAPTVRSPFAVQQPFPPLTSHSVSSS